MIFPSETHSVIADGRTTALASVHSHGLQLCCLFLFFLQRVTDCFSDILSKGEVSKEEQVQKELSWRVKRKVSFRYNDQGKRECVCPNQLSTHETQELKPDS